MGKINKWTIKEIEYLKRAYPTALSMEDIIENLPGRTEYSIRLKASRLKLKRPFNNDSTVFEKVRCYGKDFEDQCVDTCPDWFNCLNRFAEAQKEHILIKPNENKVTITAHVATSQVIEALRGLYKIE